MNTLSVLIGGLLLALGVLFVIRLWWVIAANLAAGRAYRTALARRLQRLRLARMLRVLGMDIDAYLARQDINRLHRQMQNCAECDHTVACDEYLQQGEAPRAAPAFCNNEAGLNRLLESAPESDSPRTHPDPAPPRSSGA